MTHIEVTRHPAASQQPARDSFIEDNLRVLEQGRRLMMSLDALGYGGLHHAGASVGAHFRHVLDHYLCLREGLSLGVVDYDARRRDPRTELDRDYATDIATQVEAWLCTLDDVALRRSLSVRLHTGAEGDEDAGLHPTTVRRELHFAMTHTVHHYACMAIDLKLRGEPCAPDFGVAPATLGYRRSAT